MNSKIIHYLFISLLVASFFWFYFQITTFPYKVARWVQPLEAKTVSVFAKNCSPKSSWLHMFVEHAVVLEGAYSAQVAFIDEHKLQHNCVIGYKNTLFGASVNAMHRYRYASATKLITVAVVKDLIFKGVLHNEDTLVSFFPELKHFDDLRIAHITIADLLNHRAGFNRLTLNGDPMFLWDAKPWCPHDLRRLQSLVLAFSPGQKQIYSNLGYCLLGAVVERVSGQKFRDYVEGQFSLEKRNIKFINNYYYDDEVRYDYRYEASYDDSYLKLFDFEAISAVAGLSGSAVAFAQLVWNIHHSQPYSPFLSEPSQCALIMQKNPGCLSSGVFHYQVDSFSLALHFHEGYLPGAASIAIVDNFGGVTVLVKSGANRYQQNRNNEWLPWIYRRLTLHYILQGKLPLLNYYKLIK